MDLFLSLETPSDSSERRTSAPEADIADR